FEAAADGVTGVILAIRNRRAERGRRDRVLSVGPCETTLGVEQHRIHREARAAGHAAEGVDLDLLRRNDAAAEVGGDAVLDARGSGIHFDTEDELAAGELPVVANGAAAKAAGSVAVVPAIAAHRADIEAGPVIRRNHRRRGRL